MLGAVAYAGGVAEDVFDSIPLGFHINRIARGPGNIAYGGAFIMKDGIDHRRFSDVGATDKGEFWNTHRNFLLRIFGWRQKRFDQFHKVADAATMGGADGACVLESQARKIKGA